MWSDWKTSTTPTPWSSPSLISDHSHAGQLKILYLCRGLDGVPGLDRQILLARASDPKSRGRGQPGPRTGYAPPRAIPWYEPGNPNPSFDEPDIWAFRCSCGATPKVSKPTLHRLVGEAFARGERRITLP